MVYFSLCFFLYIPLLIAGLYSFNSVKQPVWSSFSLRWYIELFQHSPQLWNAVFNSILTGFLSALFSICISLPAAWAWKIQKLKGGGFAWLLTYSSLLLPDILIGISLLIFFATVQFTLGLSSVIIAHTMFNIPFSYLLLSRRLAEFDTSQLEAAKDSGATEWIAFRTVVFPQIWGTLLSSFLLCVTLSLDDFVVTFFVSGPGASTLPVHVYGLMRFGVSPVINALSVLVVIVILAGLIISGKTMHPLRKLEK